MMQLPLTDGRAIRMIVALLAAADPLDHVQRGAPTAAYEPLAAVLLAALRNGADSRGLVAVVIDQLSGADEDDLPQIDLLQAFGEAVADWWANAAVRWDVPVAV